MRKYKAFLGHPIVANAISNLAGQMETNIRDPKNNHYSMVSFLATLTGATVAHKITKPINVGFTKTMIDSMIVGPATAVGFSLGKSTGY